MARLSRLVLTDFRSYPTAIVEPSSQFVVLTGDNGAGKTNLLEAVSLLAPGRGLRGAPLSEMARHGGHGGFAIAAHVDDVEIGTGVQPTASERRQVRVNGAPAAVNSLSEWLAVLWVTPAMDRLFAASAGDRRRFLDRLVLALEPAHARHAARYEAAMRARTKLLSDERGADEAWLAALEQAMGEHGQALAEARAKTVGALQDRLDQAPEGDFPRASIALDSQPFEDLAATLRANRGRDVAAGRATAGPHRQDLAVMHLAKSMPAARCSTGEQKALLLGLVLAHADLVADRRGSPPILLLDEVAAHLDSRRRTALFGRLEGRGQVWMTGTDEALFGSLPNASRFRVEGGRLHPS